MFLEKSVEYRLSSTDVALLSFGFLTIKTLWIFSSGGGFENLLIDDGVIGSR